MPNSHHCSVNGCKNAKISCSEHYWVCKGGEGQAAHEATLAFMNKKCERKITINGVYAKCGRKKNA
ncbi:hypothetical protein M422DRAFT_31121 [Sphaerobolus stellatus SS14]|uniref:Uncharacterized protein n=1 Tax=Sphaerobolus stellatus (strain SS14) TaxID=990650 RepID=A0A0C9VMH6_SPHS4|nr:hypothetical protein M422DRAFT_31121 [Sphaerobolus stellatus SS14]